jgi:hypothetical protein
VQLLFGIRKANHLKFVVAFAALEKHLSIEPAQEPWAHNLLFYIRSSGVSSGTGWPQWTDILPAAIILFWGRAAALGGWD